MLDVKSLRFKFKYIQDFEEYLSRTYKFLYLDIVHIHLEATPIWCSIVGDIIDVYFWRVDLFKY